MKEGKFIFFFRCSMEDSAEYSVEVKNPYGEAYSFATVLVRSKYKCSFGFHLPSTAGSSKHFHSLIGTHRPSGKDRTASLPCSLLGPAKGSPFRFHMDTAVLSVG